MCLAPQQAGAADKYTIANPRVTDADDTFKINSTWDLVTFGNYYVSSSTTKKPILWRVLSVDGKTALLLSEYTLRDPMKYNETYARVTWQDCTLRQFLNGIGSVYAADNYLYNAFTEAERDLLVAIDGDKVTLPTQADVVNGAYGFSTYVDTNGRRYLASSTRMAMTSANGDAGNKLGENDVAWWLRYYGDTDTESSYKDAVSGGETWTRNTNNYVDNSGRTKCYVRPMIRVTLDPSIKYAGTINVDGEDAQYLGKRITYNLLKDPQSISNVNKLDISIKPTVATYTGKQIKPTATVIFNGKKLKKGTDYTVTYGKNKAVGKGTVVVKGKGKRFNSQTLTFQIVPKTPSIKSLTATTAGFKVAVKKQTSGTITGYQVDYRVKGASEWTSVKFKTTKALSKTIKNLSGGVTYQVRVSTYKVSGGNTLCSKWSKVKTVKTKVSKKNTLAE